MRTPDTLAWLEKREETQDQDLLFDIAKKRSEVRKLPEGPKREAAWAEERSKEQLRAIVEHPFHVVKSLFRHRKVRYRGLRRNTAQLFSLERCCVSCDFLRDGFEVADPKFKRAAKTAWALLIRKIYGVDPLERPHCGDPMRFIAVFEEAPAIERILRHVGAWAPSSPLRALPARGNGPWAG